jgi:hypothetical protein
MRKEGRADLQDQPTLLARVLIADIEGIATSPSRSRLDGLG